MKFKYLLLLLAIGFLTTGCGSTGPQGPAGVPGTEPAPPALETVQSAVDQYNAWRTEQGEDPIVPGLDCTLYTVPNTTTAIIGATGLVTVGSFTYTGTFDQSDQAGTSGFNVLPSVLQSVYSTYFIVKCTGDIVIPTSAWYEFDLTSDDGSNLYINGGNPLINNDGVHTEQTDTADKNLEAGVYSFELDYFQAGGNVALILNMDDSLLPAANFYH